MQNIYLPHLMTVEDIVEETPDVRTFRLVFQDEKMRESFSFRAGQFASTRPSARGEHVLHRESLHAEGLHRDDVPARGARDGNARRPQHRRHDGVPGPLTATGSRWNRSTGRT